VVQLKRTAELANVFQPSFITCDKLENPKREIEARRKPESA
jgi:hypothetical protein